MRRIAVPALIALCLAACAGGTRQVRLPRGSLRLPLVRQSTPYTCGAAAMQSILRYYGEDIREDDLGRELESDPEEGTRFWRMLEMALRRGIEAEAFLDASLQDLKTALDAGKPAIVAFQAWAEAPVGYAEDWDDGHYAVAIGYDERNIYFMDPSTLGNYAYVPTEEFLGRWHDQYEGIKVNRLMLTFSKKPDYDPEEVLRLE
ncbi:MAG: C39 family peptidase [Elusimicrobia bacterium]|nr:C39 family peptidase [Elusimicrobiota bacterium]